jgi:uncharacterized protein (UPF0276 family)
MNKVYKNAIVAENNCYKLLHLNLFDITHIFVHKMNLKRYTYLRNCLKTIHKIHVSI